MTPAARILGRPARGADVPAPDGRAYGIRLALAEVKGITDAEVARIVAGRPYASLADFWHRARVVPPGRRAARRGRGVRQPLRHRVGRARPAPRPGHPSRPAPPGRRPRPVDRAVDRGARRPRPAPVPSAGHEQSRRPRPPGCARSPAAVPGRSGRTPSDMQLALDLGDAPEVGRSGLPEMTGAERVRAELDVLGLDVSRHVVDFYAPMLDALGVTRSRELLRRRSQAEVLVAGVKVATQTPPVRSGRRVVFLTLDDAPGRSTRRSSRTPRALTPQRSSTPGCSSCADRCGAPGRGASFRATGAWELSGLLRRVGDRGPRGAVCRDRPRRAVLRRAEAVEGVGGLPVASARSWLGRPMPVQAQPDTHRADPRGRHGPASGARPRERVPAVALRRRQHPRAEDPRREAAAQAVALQPGQLRCMRSSGPAVGR